MRGLRRWTHALTLWAEPMSEGSVKTIEDAKRVATFLDTIGEHKRANDVRKLCRSNAQLRVTARALLSDNMTLREQVK